MVTFTSKIELTTLNFAGVSIHPMLLLNPGIVLEGATSRYFESFCRHGNLPLTHERHSIQAKELLFSSYFICA